MARAPRPITSPPDQPWQPYDAAAAAGVPDDQSAPTTVYNPAGGSGGDPWPKVQEAGAASWTTGEPDGTWPGNGTNTDPWTQT